jgi:serine/threonine protein kinase
MEYQENGNLRDYIEQNYCDITLQHRLQWARQAAEGLAVLHDANVIHCDLSPRNFLLDYDLNLKISDFGGSSLCGSEPSATPATRFRHPGYDWDVTPVFKDDLFSLGSLIYLSGCYPYEEVSSEEVKKFYANKQFVNVSHLVCGTIILQCWQRKVDTARAVFDYLVVAEKSVRSERV